jgi:two-component system KDP operon response regulator KdpE
MEGTMTIAQPLVLAVDDDAGILRLVQLELEAQGLRVHTAQSGPESIAKAEEEKPDVAVVDLRMPVMDGIETMKKLREGASIPAILLTGLSGTADTISGLNHGADDYLAKPFNPSELGARVRAVLRRTAASEDVKVVNCANGVAIDLVRRLVRRDGEILSLTRSEWMLLEHLARNPGKVILSSDLLSSVWGSEYREELQYLRVWISRLRAKLEKEPGDPQIIKTFSNVGYKLQALQDQPGQPAQAP